MGFLKKLFSWLNSSVEGSVALVGLGDSGKTTILHRINTNIFLEQTNVTMGLSVDTFEYNGVKFSAFDLGGQKTFQMVWEPYLRNALSVVYVVDASNPAFFQESAHVFKRTLEMMNPDAILLFLINKMDLAEKSVLIDIQEIFELRDIRTIEKVKILNYFGVSAKTGDNFDKAFSWLSKAVKHTVKEEEKAYGTEQAMVLSRGIA